MAHWIAFICFFVHDGVIRLEGISTIIKAMLIKTPTFKTIILSK